MKAYKTKNCTVRVHGNPDPEKLKGATEQYMKKVVRSKKNEKENPKENGTVTVAVG
jgi:predicted Zn-dependent peptidase